MKRPAPEVSPAAQQWEAALQARRLRSATSFSVWGDWDNGTTQCAGSAVIELQLGNNETMSIEESKLLASSPQLAALTAAVVAGNGAEAVRGIYLSFNGSRPHALRATLTYAMKAGRIEDASLWRAGPPGPVAQRARPNEEAEVADTLHAVDLLNMSQQLGLPELSQAAENRLLREDEKFGYFCDAAVMPLFAESFGKHKLISSACLRHLTENGSEILYGRERQLGVLYATHAVAATVLSGILRGAITRHRKGTTQSVSQELDPIIMDLLFGRRGSDPFSTFLGPACLH